MTRSVYPDTRELIVALLTDKGPLTAAAIAKKTGLPIVTVTANLSLLCRRDEIVKHHRGTRKLPFYTVPGDQRITEEDG